MTINERDANLNHVKAVCGMVEDEADTKRGEKTISGNGQARSSPSPRGQWRTEKNVGNWS